MVKLPSCHPLGPLLRLDGVDFDRLPHHEASKDRVQQFMTALLQEALYLIGSVDTYYSNLGTSPNPSGWKSKGNRKYRGVKETGGPGEIVVDLLERSILKSDLRAALSQADDNDNADAAGSAAAGIIAGANPAAPRRSVQKTKNPTSETWACRRSFHDNDAAGGTATWEEFGVCMKDLHVETEKAMTPTVPKAQKALQWVAAELIELIDLPDFEEGPGPWTGFTLHVVEMEHDLKQALLSHRVFPVLQMTCRSNSAPAPEILVVSVPINGWKDVPVPEIVDSKLADSSKVVLGSYVSVERFRVVPKEANRAPQLKKVSTMDKVKGSLRIKKRASIPAVVAPAVATPVVEEPSAAAVIGSGRPAASGVAQPAIVEGEQVAAIGGEQPEVNEAELSDNLQETQIEWTMATASHARGWLPLFIQTPVVPGKIAIDVPLFLKWLQNYRVATAAAVVNNQEVGHQPASEQPAGSQPVDNQPAGNQAANDQLASNPQSA